MDGSRAHPTLVLDARVCAWKSISGLHRRLNGSEYTVLLGVGENSLSETMFTSPPIEITGAKRVEMRPPGASPR